MSNAGPRASIILCTFRRRNRFARALESACAQTLPKSEYEIVVVNNDPDDDLAPILAQRRERGFAIRDFICRERGHSFAKNLAIESARGEILIFIDDDAIADADLAEIVLAAFDANPDLGLVGGRIILKDPDPLPWWWSPRGRSYWSHFDPPYAALTRVSRWQDLPWGANWSARREAMLKIGGFKTKYGRVGKNYTAGEEIAAGGMILQAGWGVAVEPRARVIHDVEPQRFTLNYIRKTILVGVLTQYQLQKEGFFPLELTLGRALKLAFLRAGATVWFLKDGAFRAWESFCYMRAYARLAWEILRAPGGKG